MMNLLNILHTSVYRFRSKINKRTKKKQKKKSKIKYKLNLLNKFYSYSKVYTAKHIRINHIYKLSHLKKFLILKNNNFNTIILYYKKIFIKKKQKKSMKYNIIVGKGTNKSWIGVGISKNSSYSSTYAISSCKSKKNIYNLNFKTSDYKIFKYKNYKFSLLNKPANKHNLSMYNNIIFLTGLKKLKLVSHSSGSSKTILKSLLYYFS